MLYPDLETYRTGDEKAAEHDYREPSNLEKNCNQFFAKGPALTKEILDKVNSAEIVPKKTYCFGRAVNTKRVVLISGLSLLFSASLFGTIMMWFTDAFDNYVYSQMVISKNSPNFEMWKNPSPKALYQIYIFNYTNVEDYRRKRVEKLHVEEVGPYAYEETLEKFNVIFNGNGTVSYQERRSYKFRPDESKGSKDDRLVVPNIPVLAGSAVTKPENYFKRLGFSGILLSLDEEAFVTLNAGEYILGYEDHLYGFSRTVSKMNNIQTPEKCGLLSAKVGENPMVTTVNTGENDIHKVGLIEKVNGKPNFGHYSSRKCDSVSSTDGSTFPLEMVHKKRPLEFLFPDLCRKMPLKFQKEVAILEGTVPAYQYSLPDDIFDTPNDTAEDRCFCSGSDGQCPLKGLFNVSICSYGVPMFASHPHFDRGDPSLRKAVTGLNSDPSQLKTIVNLHPILGFFMSGVTRMQINIQVQKAFGVSQVGFLEDGMILPLAWLAISLREDSLPQDFLDLIYLTTFTLKRARLGLKYGCLLTAIVTFIFIVLIFIRMREKNAGGILRRRSRANDIDSEEWR